MRVLILLRTLIATKLGACAFCIRLSLLLSLTSWAVFAALSFLVPGSLAAQLALVPALSFTALFASHFVAYAVRVVLAYRQAGDVAPRPNTGLGANRRRFLVFSAQTIGLVLLPTVLASALWGSVRTAPNCPRPTECPGFDCCCHGCKTKLKQCDPLYASCAMYCRMQCITVP